MNKWKEIWDNRSFENPETIEDYLTISGYDCKYSKLKEVNIVEFIDRIKMMIGFEDNDSVFHLCSGAGIFLKLFNSEKVGALDYSQNMLNYCSKLNDLQESQCYEAIKLNTELKFDHIFTHCGFNYFEDLEYAKSVLNLMLEKAKQSVMLLDVLDAQQKENDFSQRIHDNKEDYVEKYKETKHLYYEQQFFKDICEELLSKDEISSYYFLSNDEKIKDYTNAKFRFNLIIKKK